MFHVDGRSAVLSWPKLFAQSLIVTLSVTVFACVVEGWADSPAFLRITIVSMAMLTTPTTIPRLISGVCVLISARLVLGLNGVIHITLIGAFHCISFDYVSYL